MKHRLKTKAGKALYAKRKSTVETVFGIIKAMLGFRRFHLRGLESGRRGMELSVYGLEFEANVCVIELNNE